MTQEQINAPWATRDAAPKTEAAKIAEHVAAQGAENGADTAGSTATPSEGTNGPASPDSGAAQPPAAVAGYIESQRPEVADEVTVTVTVAKAFKLRIDHHSIFDYQPGVQEMPLSHADHWYSKANGVKIYTR